MASCGVIDMKQKPAAFLLHHDHRDIVKSKRVKTSIYLVGMAGPFPQLLDAFRKEGRNGDTASSYKSSFNHVLKLLYVYYYGMPIC